MISRTRALELLEEHVADEALRAHSLATEAVLRALARRLGANEDLWGITGLLHDIDFPQTRDEPTRHGLLARRLLEGEDLPEEALRAIEAHNGEENGTPVTEPFHYALRCGETVTGLVSAAALVQPDKKLSSVKVKSLKKKFKDKAFARRVDRNIIRECEALGLELPEFLALALEAMQGIAPELGL